MNLKDCIPTSVSTKKDGSVKIVLETRELTPIQMAELFLNVNKEVMQIEVPDDSYEGKSKSTRLRNVLYRFWEQHGKEKFESAELHYAHHMEKLIDHFKDKLD